MNTKCMRSIGIDLGTTTSQVIFSELEIVNTAIIDEAGFHSTAMSPVSIFFENRWDADLDR